MSRRRWDDDARGIGTGDARAWRPLVESLATIVDKDGWVAEEPELHLLPHLEAATAARPLAIRGSGTDTDGTFVVDLAWTGPGEPSRLAIRSALYALIATIAETVTLLHEPPDAEGRVLELLSGSGGGDAPFAGHGHTVRLVVSTPAADRSGDPT